MTVIAKKLQRSAYDECVDTRISVKKSLFVKIEL